MHNLKDIYVCVNRMFVCVNFLYLIFYWKSIPRVFLNCLLLLFLLNCAMHFIQLHLFANSIHYYFWWIEFISFALHANKKQQRSSGSIIHLAIGFIFRVVFVCFVAMIAWVTKAPKQQLHWTTNQIFQSINESENQAQHRVNASKSSRVSVHTSITIIAHALAPSLSFSIFLSLTLLILYRHSCDCFIQKRTHYEHRMTTEKRVAFGIWG